MILNRWSYRGAIKKGDELGDAASPSWGAKVDDDDGGTHRQHDAHPHAPRPAQPDLILLCELQHYIQQKLNTSVIPRDWETVEYRG